MSYKSPLAVVNDKFGGKDKLVDKLVGFLESDESKDALRKRLLGVANQKLLRLHHVATTVKEKYGSRDKLVAQTVTALGRTKDKDYVARLEDLSSARLVDIARQAERRAKAATKATADAANPKPAAARKAAAKPAAAKPAARVTKRPSP